MNFQDILTKILVIADYPDEKRTQFINIFYEYLFVKVLQELEKSDPASYHLLLETFRKSANDTEQISKGLLAAYEKPELKDRIDKVIGEVVGELVNDISKHATEHQKKKILESLPN